MENNLLAITICKIANLMMMHQHIERAGALAVIKRSTEGVTDEIFNEAAQICSDYCVITGEINGTFYQTLSAASPLKPQKSFQEMCEFTTSLYNQ